MKAGWLQDADHRHGIQMALIVMRTNTGATLGAGWDHVRGTAVGTLGELFGVWLRHRGLSLPGATLLVVALLAFGSGLVQTLRSAPITALIVVSSGDVAGHSAFAVAGLRTVEIAIGIAAGLAVTALAPSARAAPRFDRACHGAAAPTLRTRQGHGTGNARR